MQSHITISNNNLLPNLLPKRTVVFWPRLSSYAAGIFTAMHFRAITANRSFKLRNNNRPLSARYYQFLAQMTFKI